MLYALVTYILLPFPDNFIVWSYVIGLHFCECVCVSVCWIIYEIYILISNKLGGLVDIVTLLEMVNLSVTRTWKRFHKGKKFGRNFDRV